MKFGSKCGTFCPLVKNGEGVGKFLSIFMEEFQGPHLLDENNGRPSGCSLSISSGGLTSNHAHIKQYFEHIQIHHETYCRSNTEI